MKKLLLLTVPTSVISVSVSAVEKLIVAAMPILHAEIPELIEPTLAKEGVDLQIKVFTGYVQPNIQITEKHLDANYFQTLLYLGDFNKGKGTNPVTVIGIHVEPSGNYSRKHKSLVELSNGATVATPSEGNNSGHVLLLLWKVDLLKLKDPNNALVTSKDIAENPKNLRFKELESALLPHVLDQVDPDLININYALETKLNPAKDMLILEDCGSPHVNYLVARPDNRDSDALRKLSAILTSLEMKAFIEKRYASAVIPAF